MPIPERKDDLESLGYTYQGTSHCRGCGEEIEWYETPNGKKMPMSVVEEKREELRRPHFATCVKADDFRKKK